MAKSAGNPAIETIARCCWSFCSPNISHLLPENYIRAAGLTVKDSLARRPIPPRRPTQLGAAADALLLYDGSELSAADRWTTTSEKVAVAAIAESYRSVRLNCASNLL